MKCQNIYRRINDALLRYYVRYHPYRYGLKTGESGKPKIIISLTTYPPRFPYAAQCIKSLLLQTMKPDAILVWIDREYMDVIPQDMRNLEQYGVIYRPCDGDLKPHKKYFFALQEYSDDIVITGDDDLVYPPTLVSSLMKKYRQYPHCVCARRVHGICQNADGALMPYREWEYETVHYTLPSHRLLVTTGAGALYPPHCFGAEAFDVEKIRKLCLRADDLWLKFIELEQNIQVVWVKCYWILPPKVPHSQEMKLSTLNVDKGENDVYLKALLEEYPEAKEKIFS